MQKLNLCYIFKKVNIYSIKNLEHKVKIYLCQSISRVAACY